LLDTGAVCTMIAWDVAKDIGYDPAVAPRRTSIVTANGVVDVPVITVAAVTLGDVCAENVEVVVHDIPEIADIQGLLGLSFLRHCRTVIDYAAGSLEITEGR